MEASVKLSATVTLELTPKELATLFAATGQTSDADLLACSKTDKKDVLQGVDSYQLYINLGKVYDDLVEKGAFKLETN